jgi:hypothetical protein
MTPFPTCEASTEISEGPVTNCQVVRRPFPHASRGLSRASERFSAPTVFSGGDGTNAFGGRSRRAARSSPQRLAMRTSPSCDK